MASGELVTPPPPRPRPPPPRPPREVLELPPSPRPRPPPPRPPREVLELPPSPSPRPPRLPREVLELPPHPPREGLEPPPRENEVKDEEGSSTRPSSPDPSCPICLDNVTDAAYTDMCCHRFCFHCLVCWSRVKPECPLCKQRFNFIIHNVRSMGDYDELPVSWAEPPPPSLDANFFISVAFQRPRTTSGGPWNGWRFQNLFRNPSQDILPGSSFPPLPLPTTSALVNPPVLPPAPQTSFNNPAIPSSFFESSNAATHWRRRRQVSACEFRTNVYRQNMWVRPIEQAPGVPYRIRECSPNFYRDNRAQLNRLLPWLHRELLILLDVRQDYDAICERIINTITTIPIRSPRFQAIMWPYLHERTAHFCHEFYHFAISPYDMLAYDLRAQYVRRDEIVTDVVTSDQENQDNRNSDSSDIEIIEPEPAEVIEISDEDDVTRVEVETVRNDSDVSVEIISDSELPPRPHNSPEIIDLVNDSGPELIPSGCDSPVAGSSSNNKEILLDRLRNKRPLYYKDDSTSSEEELPRKRPQRKRKRKSEAMKQRRNIVENYSSNSDTGEIVEHYTMAHSVKTRSKTKYPNISSQSEDKSSKSTSSNSNTDSSGPSSSRCRRKRDSSKYKKKIKTNGSTDCGSFKTEVQSPSNISAEFSRVSPNFESELDNQSNGSFKWATIFSNSASDNDLVIDKDRDETPSPKPRLKSVVRKVEPLGEASSPAGCSSWPGHNLRQRKLKHAYTAYFSHISDSDS